VPQDRIAVSLADTKQAALYFDYVVPIFLVLDVAVEVGTENLVGLEERNYHASKLFRETRDKILRFVPPSLLEFDNFDRWGEINGVFYGELDDLRSYLPDLNALPISALSNYVSVEPEARRRMHQLNKKLKKFLRHLRIVDPVFAGGRTLFAEQTEPTADKTYDAFVKISGLQLIDTDSVTFDEIDEFRKDKEAIRKLRRLRLFAATNYDGKSVNYIEDDLLQRIDDYKAEVRRWSFKTKTAAAAMLFQSKLLAGGIGCSLVGALLDKPLISVASAAIGTIAEFGNVAVEVARMNFVASEALGDNPVSYIIDARKTLGTR
jgi:hypothetical protein